MRCSRPTRNAPSELRRPRVLLRSSSDIVLASQRTLHGIRKIFSSSVAPLRTWDGTRCSNQPSAISIQPGESVGCPWVSLNCLTDCKRVTQQFAELADAFGAFRLLASMRCSGPACPLSYFTGLERFSVHPVIYSAGKPENVTRSSKNFFLALLLR
jgi:hypothetical protein